MTVLKNPLCGSSRDGTAAQPDEDAWTGWRRPTRDRPWPIIIPRTLASNRHDSPPALPQGHHESTTRRQNNTGHSRRRAQPSHARVPVTLRAGGVGADRTALGRQDRVLRFAQLPRARRVGGTRSRRLGLGSGRWDLFVADACGRLHFSPSGTGYPNKAWNGLQGVCVPMAMFGSAFF